MKISFIIVSWNVKELLRGCIQSIFERLYPFSVEVTVIDNASQDGSADMVSRNFPSVNLIINNENRGFGAACNQGIAKSTGEYIFLLNPDCVFEDGTLEKLVSYMDGHKEVGLCAPQLLNSDGSIQKSVRRFPTPFSQLLVLLKLRRFAKFIPSLKRYFALDFDYSKDEQDIDQPMGAAMIIRSDVLAKAGVFDERFYLWFEEVDLCKRIKETGWKIKFLSSLRVIHHSGKSFVQQSIFERQRNFFRSCGMYLKKHCGLSGNIIGAFMVFFALGIDCLLMKRDFFSLIRMGEKKDMIGHVSQDGYFFSRSLFVTTLVSIIGVEVLSYIGYVIPPVNSLVFGLLVSAALLLSIRKLEYGVAVLLSELVIGSQGHLFSITVGSASISLRMGLFAVLFFAWMAYEARTFFSTKSKNNNFVSLIQKSPLMRWYAILFCFVLWGIANALLRQNVRGLIFDDANAWFFFLIVPVMHRAIDSRSALNRILTIACAALAAQILKVLAAFYVMGHKGFGLDIIITFYRWIRSTGVGEITEFDVLYRIFFQSQIYIVFLFLILLCVLWYRARENRTTNIKTYLKNVSVPIIFLIGTSASLILSFSRSFWLATVIVGFTLFLCIISTIKKQYRQVLTWVAISAGAVVCALILLFAISVFPLPSTRGAFDLSALSDRVKNLQDEAAAASRWNLLPVLGREIIKNPILGYGFGKTVTYTSRDPRVLAANPQGSYTTYAFEWGYLDILLKLGIGGLIAYFLLLIALCKQGVLTLKVLAKKHSDRESALVAGMLFGIGTLVVVHALTPYLDHPLGIAYLVFCGVIFQRLKDENALDVRE